MQQDASHQNQEHGNLECDWESPNERGCAVSVERATVLEPVGYDHTEDVEGEFDGNKLPTRLVLSGFRSPNGYDGIENARAPAVDQSRTNHPFRVHGRAL